MADGSWHATTAEGCRWAWSPSAIGLQHWQFSQTVAGDLQAAVMWPRHAVKGPCKSLGTTFPYRPCPRSHSLPSGCLHTLMWSQCFLAAVNTQTPSIQLSTDAMLRGRMLLGAIYMQE